MTTPRRRRYTPIEIQREILKLADEGFAPKQIEDELSKPGGFASQHPDLRLPNLRTIQRMVAAHIPADDSAIWELQPVEEADPTICFDILRSVVKHTDARVVTLTAEEARWITAIRRVAPDLTDWLTYTTARAYIGRRLRHEQTLYLDLMLMFAGKKPGSVETLLQVYRNGAALGTIALPLSDGSWYSGLNEEAVVFTADDESPGDSYVYAGRIEGDVDKAG